MKESKIQNKNITTYIKEFNSMWEFFNHITTAPFNPAWEKSYNRASVTGSKSFTGSASFDEAANLFKDGWSEEAEKLTHLLKEKKLDTVTSMKARPAYSVQGFQCSVPRYLQGLPDSMINKKNVPVKQKVITINKVISYSCFVTTKEIEEQSVKALSLINNIESQGVRCNLNVIWSIHEGKTREIFKVRIKSSDERINVTKLAFPLVHPSMLRRLMFRALEVSPTAIKGYVHGYGHPDHADTIKGLLKQLGCENEYVIPQFLPNNINDITSLQSL